LDSCWIFYFPDRESIVVVKKIDVEILMNLHVCPRSPEKWFLKNVVCTLNSVLCDGHWRRKYKRDQDGTLDEGQDKDIDAVFWDLV